MNITTNGCPTYGGKETKFTVSNIETTINVTYKMNNAIRKYWPVTTRTF
jgi:hypothetical protein